MMAENNGNRDTKIIEWTSENKMQEFIWKKKKGGTECERFEIKTEHKFFCWFVVVNAICYGMPFNTVLFLLFLSIFYIICRYSCCIVLFGLLHYILSVFDDLWINTYANLMCLFATCELFSLITMGFSLMIFTTNILLFMFFFSICIVAFLYL